MYNIPEEDIVIGLEKEITVVGKMVRKDEINIEKKMFIELEWKEV